MQSPLDFPLCEHGEALIEPEMLEVKVGDEVSSPRVGDFVGDHVSVGLVSGEQGRGGEGHTGVFHSSVCKRWRQNEDVVVPPHVGTTQLLCSLNERFSLGEVEG